MIYLFSIIIPYLLGRGALRAFYWKKETSDFTLADSIVVGGMVVIGLAEAAHMGAVVLGRSFSDCVKLFLIGLVVLLTISAVLLVLGRKKKREKLSSREQQRLKVKKLMVQDEEKNHQRGMIVLFCILILIQILQIVTEQNPYLVGDMTAETVNSMLSTNTIYQVNPMTGQPYTLGIPMRLKILCLPTLYGMMCELFGMSVTAVVWIVVPVLTLLGSYAAFYTVSKGLFGEDIPKRAYFMIGIALVLWLNDSLYGLDGFALHYAGYRGVSIRMGILLPYTIGLILRKKWRLVLLCILAEACIVWTLYGMGACLFVAVGMILLGRKLSCGRKEVSE